MYRSIASTIMYYDFKVNSTHRSYKLNNGKKICVTNQQTSIIVRNVSILGNSIFLGQGYKYWTEEKTKMPLEYDCHGHAVKDITYHDVRVKEGDTWQYCNRTFVVGKREERDTTTVMTSNGLNHIGEQAYGYWTAPLMEDGKQVATIIFEDFNLD